MRQAFLFAGRCHKELRRDSLFAPFCLVVPAFMLLLSRLTVHYYASDRFSLVSLFAGAMIFSQAMLCIFIASLVSCDKKIDYLLKLRLAYVKPRSAFWGYLLSGVYVSFVQFLACFFTAAFLSMFGENDFIVSSFFVLFVRQIPSLLFFLFAGILLGALFSLHLVRILCAFGAVVAVLCCGVYLPLSAFGRLSSAFASLPYALFASLFAENAPRTLLFSLVYAFSAALLGFAAFRKKYLK